MKPNMRIRKSLLSDVPRMLEIYEYARQFMRRSGNPTQWRDGYPSIDLLRSDIERGISFVVESDEIVVATFVFVIGEEPTYMHIEGKWCDNGSYGTVHRIASDGSVKGIADFCLKYCKGIIGNIRIDTHSDNHVMLSWIRRSGFSYCGVIHVSDGTPRYAFQLKDINRKIGK